MSIFVRDVFVRNSAFLRWPFLFSLQKTLDFTSCHPIIVPYFSRTYFYCPSQFFKEPPSYHDDSGKSFGQGMIHLHKATNDLDSNILLPKQILLSPKTHSISSAFSDNAASSEDFARIWFDTRGPHEYWLISIIHHLLVSSCSWIQPLCVKRKEN